MKVAERVMDVESTLQGEKVAMTLDMNATAHLMSVLTDLYSNPRLAVIREYSTNAYDAHVDAGVTRPIEVTLPSSLSRFFKVRDYGTGLDANDIREIYSRYGTSTKRESNDVVGMLGLGCKSALTYTDQFTVTGIKNGKAIQVAVSRDADGSGSMTIVAEYDTEDPSGVEVVVPTSSDSNYFESEAKEFFRFWGEGTVLVNGKSPKRVDGVWLTDKIVLSHELERDYIVMGNVAYPYENPLRHYRDVHAATYVEIGEVNFTPSREALMMTKQTKNTIEKVTETIKRERDIAFQREIDAAPTKQEGLAAYFKVAEMGYKVDDPSWNGVKLPLVLKSADEKNPYSILTLSGYGYRGEKKGSRSPQLYTKPLGKMRFFENFTSLEFSPYKRKKLDLWMLAQYPAILTPENWVFFDQIPAEIREWLPADRVHDWTVVDAIKIPANTTREDGRPTGSYDVMVAAKKNVSGKKLIWTNYHERGVIATDIDTSKPLYWAMKSDYVQSYYNLFNTTHQNGYTLVFLSKNRVNKFQRDFPMAKRMTETVGDIVKKWEAGLTDDDKLFLCVREHGDAWLKVLDHSRIQDPELADAAKLCQANDRDALAQTYREFSGMTTFETEWDCPTKKYALLDEVGVWSYNSRVKRNQDHIIIYLNAAYAVSQEA